MFSIYFLSLFFITFDYLSTISAISTKEIDNFQTLGREKRYVTRGKRWKKHRFYWQLSPQNLLEADVFIVRNTLHRAFNEWAKVSSLEFIEVKFGEKRKEKLDLLIAFERGEHKDGFTFDGEGGVVAHAFYPRDGRLHFDADEQWSLNTEEGVNLFQTAVHEIGHLLGLEHSMDLRAAMFAAKRPYDPGFTLGDDDVRAIRTLFPTSTTTSSPTTVTRTTTTTEVTVMSEEMRDPFEEDQQEEKSNTDSFFPFPLPSLEHFQRRSDWFML